MVIFYGDGNDSPPSLLCISPTSSSNQCSIFHTSALPFAFCLIAYLIIKFPLITAQAFARGSTLGNTIGILKKYDGSNIFAVNCHVQCFTGRKLVRGGSRGMRQSPPLLQRDNWCLCEHCPLFVTASIRRLYNVHVVVLILPESSKRFLNNLNWLERKTAARLIY